MAGHFEAKKHGYRQTQDGVVVSFVLHPNDLDAAFAIAALGTRYIIAFQEIGDDEKPVEGPKRTAIVDSPAYKADQKARTDQTKELVDKVRKPFDSLPLVQQCGILCKDTGFQQFVVENYSGPLPYKVTEDNAATLVRQECCISSRSDLDKNEVAATIWRNMERLYQFWLTSKKYEGSLR